jgi:hypothetical protein
MEAMYFSRISRDGAFVAVPLLEGIQLWDGAQTRSIGPPLAERLGIDASGTRLVVAVRGELSAWQVATGARLWTASLPAATGRELARFDAPGASLVLLSPDRAKLAVVDGKQTQVEVQDSGTRGPLARVTEVALVLDLRDQRVTRFTGHQDLLGAVAFSPDDRTLLSGCNDHTTRVWDLASSRELARLTTSGTPGSIEFAGAGARIVTGTSDRIARIWDAATRQLVRSFEHSSAVEYATLTADGSLLAAGPATAPSGSGTPRRRPCSPSSTTPPGSTGWRSRRTAAGCSAPAMPIARSSRASSSRPDRRTSPPPRAVPAERDPARERDAELRSAVTATDHPGSARRSGWPQRSGVERIPGQPASRALRSRPRRASFWYSELRGMPSRIAARCTFCCSAS